MLAVDKISAQIFKEKSRNSCRIIDLRPIEEFSAFHIPGSLYLNSHYNFNKHIEQFLFPDQAILLVVNENDEKQVIEKFDSLGFNNIQGILNGSINAWTEKNYSLDVVISISTEELLLEINHGHIQLIDIRSKNEFDLKHLEDSENLPLEYLLSEYEILDKNSEMCIFCSNGEESMTLISYLKINGIHNIYHLEGGFKELEKFPEFKFEVSPDLN